LITQPALSHSIGKLEEELGVPLFERSGRNVLLNRYGEVFAKRVEAALQEIRRGKREIEELTNPESGTVALAFLHTLGNEFVPALIRAFRDRYPSIQFELCQGSNPFIRQQLEKGACDFCITSPKMEEHGLLWKPLAEEELYVAVPKGHKLAGRKEAELSAINEEPFVGLNPNCGFRSIYDRIFENAGFKPKAAFEAEDLTTAAGFVSAGLGVSLLPCAAGLRMEGISWIEIKPKCTCTIGLVWKDKRYLSPAAKLFQQFCLSY